MTTKYPPRVTKYVMKMCQCGHYEFNHPLEGFTLRNTPRICLGLKSRRLPCEKCMCNNYVYEKSECYAFVDGKPCINVDFRTEEELR